MKYTEKLKLKKPEEEDFISLSDYTDNMDTIDQAVTDASQKADNAISAAASATTAAQNAQTAAREATGSVQSAIMAADKAKKAADANNTELKNKVAVEKGKGLSECNYTKEEKNKLAGIQTMQGTDGEENGKEGLVPIPEADDVGSFPVLLWSMVTNMVGVCCSSKNRESGVEWRKQCCDNSGS